MRASSRRRDGVEELLLAGFRYALALTHRRDVADDLLQDAWVSLLRANGPCERAYLFRAVRTRFIDRYRRERLVALESVGPQEIADLEVHEPRLDVAPHQLEAALGGLRAEEREALFLSAVEGYTAAEIADLVARPRGTVLSLLHAARRKLRARLERGRREARS